MIKLYKNNRGRIICHITQEGVFFKVRTGKPSDRQFICWKYKTLAEAEKTAEEYFNNYTKM